MTWLIRRHRRIDTDADMVAAATRHERRALARDLHDGVGQELYATHLALTALREQVPRPLQATVDQLLDRQGRTIALLRSVVDRRTAPDAPVHTDELVASLDRLVARELGRSAHVSRSGEAPTQVPATLAQHAWRSLREMVSNATRHSGARHIDVGVDLDGRWLTLTVADDGPGVTTPLRPGHGLVNLDTRARLCGGSFRLRRREPSGTTAEWRARTTGCHHEATTVGVSRP